MKVAAAADRQIPLSDSSVRTCRVCHESSHSGWRLFLWLSRT